MIQKWERLIWGAALLIAIAITAGVSTNRGNAVALPQAKVAEGGGKTLRPGASPDEANRTLARDEEKLRKVANQALSTPSRTERFQRVMVLLDATTAENWKTIWHEYIRQTLEEGRVHEEEWSLFMTRVGEVAGEDAVEYFTHNGQSDFTFNRREVLKGWSAASPEAAYAWLMKQPDNARPPEFWGAIFEGATARDPERATGWLKDVPPQILGPVTKSMVGDQIQARGFPDTILTLEKLAKEIPSGGSIPPHLQGFYDELKSRAGRMEWLAGSYPEMNAITPDMSRLTAIFESADQ